MGMYTEVFASLRIPADNTKVVNFLDALINHFEENEELIETMAKEFNHPFFETARWLSVFYGKSAYFHSDDVKFVRHENFVDSYYELTVLSSLKSYGTEIDLFFDWIVNEICYIHYESFLGYSLYEEDNAPTTYHAIMNTDNSNKEFKVVKRKPLTYDENVINV